MSIHVELRDVLRVGNDDSYEIGVGLVDMDRLFGEVR